MKELRIKTIGLALSTSFVILYTLCAVFDLVWPGWAMYRAWQVVFPGFTWSPGGFVLGLAEAIVYGFLAAIVFVPVYNYFQRREARTVEPIAAGQHGS